MRGPTRRTVVTVAALPFALALALGASSQRMVDRWWPTFPHERLSAAPDGSVRLSDTLDDAKGTHPRVVTMRFVSLSRVNDYQESADARTLPATIPAGQTMWRLTLHFAADPSTILGACQVQLRDADGRQYTAGVGDTVEDVLDFPSCTPPGAAGPMPALSADDTATFDPRPAEYDRRYHLLLPTGVQPDNVRVWFDTPLYAEFEVPSS
ncbi:hypothetical protein SAMN04489867_0986 [Pedococcus dokdonensis]|uniref:Uncharacterized protein n=1 Tax=Pedococcus dokdonensis TaxID=443156 RepID=A0A1H0NMZ4_9MICO|nr:hypothetical protein [Pedococcus dokdonensis]SDO94011.1 hypothetical protein SAMN04489867_0986 [Pedococcus dokdonensis]